METKMKTKKASKLETTKFETLSKQDLSKMKGGGKWIYNVVKQKWYWIE